MTTTQPMPDTAVSSHGSTNASANDPVFARSRRSSGTDRRRYSLETLRRSVVAPRRTSARRRADRRYPLLDAYDGTMLALAVALVGLSVVDATFTLQLLASGGREVNPFMAWLLGYGVAPFAAVKMLLTGVPAVLLVATGNLVVFGRFRARSALAALVGLYGGLIVYELGLLSLL